MVPCGLAGQVLQVLQRYLRRWSRQEACLPSRVDVHRMASHQPRDHQPEARPGYGDLGHTKKIRLDEH